MIANYLQKSAHFSEIFESLAAKGTEIGWEIAAGVEVMGRRLTTRL